MKNIKVELLPGFDLRPGDKIKAKLSANKNVGDKITIGLPALEQRSIKELRKYFAVLKRFSENINEKTIAMFLKFVFEPLMINSELYIDPKFLHEFFKRLFDLKSAAFNNCESKEFNKYFNQVIKVVCICLGITEQELEEMYLGDI